MADVVVITMSEFGRTVAENGNRGPTTVMRRRCSFSAAVGAAAA